MANARIVGPGVCSRGRLLGHDADELRANLGEDGRTSCIVCGRISEQVSPELAAKAARQPAFIRQLIADLISAKDVDSPTFRLIQVQNQLDEPLSDAQRSDRASAMLAQDIDASVLDVTRVTLSLAPHAFEKLVMSYTPADVKSVQKAKQPAAQNLDVFTKAHAPHGVLKAAQDLVDHGFTVVGGDFDSGLRTAILTRGDASSGAVRVELSWIVC